MGGGCCVVKRCGVTISPHSKHTRAAIAVACEMRRRCTRHVCEVQLTLLLLLLLP